ncbi:MAG: TerC family protein [Alphaproteobacteria bacterium]|nr:TerC family protein [Alphaproteobacteria bacterium]MBO6628240.1 TerC family protein [Alphaproteobacteria bacterium]MDF1625071.1 TerC family protein [Parvibaculaceae bacterium]
MLELLTDPQAWISLATLAVLEIVLGIDNLIFLTILAARAPEHRRDAVRKWGLAGALISRLVLLMSIAWVIGLTAPVFTAFDMAFSWRDMVLFFGGLFLLAKGTTEIHGTVEGYGHDNAAGAATMSVAGAIVQIAILDIVFSLDSVITAVGMAEHVEIMVLAVLIAMAVMLFAAGPVGRFVEEHPTVKMLALAFLILVGASLIADGLHFHIPRGYIYFAIAFSIGVETLNLWAAARRKRRRARQSISQ